MFSFFSQREQDKDSDFRSLLRVARTSWSLLSGNEKAFFLVRLFVRFALNGLDIIAVGLMGLLGAITATGISGQRLQLFGYSIPAPTAGNVIALVAAVAGLFILKGGLGILFARWTAIFLASIEIKNSAKLTRYLFSGPLTRLKQYSRSEIQFLVETSVNATFSGVLGSMATLIIESTLFISIFVMFLLVDWPAALAIAVYFALLVFMLQMTTARRYLQSGRNLRRGSVETGGSILEMVDGFREISVLSKQDFFLTRFIEAKKLSARTGVTLQILKSLPRYVAETGLIIGALGFVVWQLSRGSLGEGLLALGIFLAGSFRMMGSILPLQALWNELRIMQGWVEMAQEILLTLRDDPELLDSAIYSETKVINRVAPQDPHSSALEVELEGVYFTHLDNTEPTIRDVSLAIPAGSYVAVVGPSGAGKTSLVDVLLGILYPTSGSVKLSSTPPLEAFSKWPGAVSYLPQDIEIVNGSVRDNICLGLSAKKVSDELLWEAVDGAQLRSLVESLPLGLDAQMGERGMKISGGQRQRLGIARALLSKPKLIVLDEATSALDGETEFKVTESLLALKGKVTIVMIAHRLSTIREADQIYYLENGEIAASGNFQELKDSHPHFAEQAELMGI